MAGEHFSNLQPAQYPHVMSGVRLLRCVMTVDLAVHHSQHGTNRIDSGIRVSEMPFEVHNKEVHKQDQTEELFSIPKRLFQFKHVIPTVEI